MMIEWSAFYDDKINVPVSLVVNVVFRLQPLQPKLQLVPIWATEPILKHFIPVSHVHNKMYEYGAQV